MFKNINFMNDYSNFWCPYVYNSFDISVEGRYGACCRFKKFNSNITDTSIENFINSKELNEIRKEMETNNLDKTLYHCCKCIESEKLKILSKRQILLDQIQKKILNENNFLRRLDNTIEKSLNNQYIELSTVAFDLIDFQVFGNLCNLSCIMCWPDSSSKIAEERIKEGTWTNPALLNKYRDMSTELREKFYKDINDIIPNLNMLKFTGGEPLLNKDILDLISFVIDSGYSHQIDLQITTNGTIVPDKFIQNAEKFKNFYCNISVDAYGDLNSVQRKGSNFKIIEENIKKYQKCKNIRLDLMSTITPITCSRIDELCMYAQYKFNIPVYLSICLNPKEFSIQYLPDEIRKLYYDKLIKCTDKMPNLKVICNILKNGKYNETVFKSYLNKLKKYYDVDFILKYFPEYKSYV